MKISYLVVLIPLLHVSYSAPLSPEQAEIHTLIVEHVLNQANIPVSFRMQAPSIPFIGRVSELDEIQWSHIDRKIVVLTGPRGVGKSELAKKYAQDFKLDNTSSTLWINSESHLSVGDAFRDLAITVGIRTEGKGGTTIIRDVISHFSNRKSLFIFDNAEDNNLIVDNLPAWIGKSKFINVIVTSRDEGWDENKYRIIKVKPFTLEEATEYIKKTILKDISLSLDDESCKNLAELMNYNPMALNDAVKDIIKQNSVNPGKVYNIIDFIESFNAKPIQTVVTEIRGPTDDELEDAVSKKIREELKRPGDAIANEAKRLGRKLKAEGKRLERRLKKLFG